MTQYIDHTYSSCLNFATNFKFTCGSLITPMEHEGTVEEYEDAAKSVPIPCNNFLESECIGDTYAPNSFQSSVW